VVGATEHLRGYGWSVFIPFIVVSTRARLTFFPVSSAWQVDLGLLREASSGRLGGLAHRGGRSSRLGGLQGAEMGFGNAGARLVSLPFFFLSRLSYRH
jgi:hypothetical protein